MLQHVLARIEERQAARNFSGRFQASLPAICRAWVILSILVVAARAMAGAGHSSALHAPVLLGALVAPVLALHFTLRHVSVGHLFAQPARRFARLGRWRELNAIDCTSFSHYGAAGLLSMLLAGLLLNIPVRTFEFVTAMPTPTLHAPNWYPPLYALMLTDLVLLSTCYAALVGLAIRRVPYFPRLLMATWLLDLTAQFAIGGIMEMVPNVPSAVQTALTSLLTGNLQKVMISMVIWVPYLFMSPRINLTYRHRIPARLAVRVPQS